VQNAPKKLSHFENDPGYLLKQDLKPLEDKLLANVTQTNNQFAAVEAQRISLEKRVDLHESRLETQETGLISVNKTNTTIQNQVNQNFNTLSAQLNDQRAQTINQFNSLGGSYESLSNKSTATDLGSGSPSNQAYPSQQAVKTYVDQAISQVVVSGAPDATTLAPGKVQLSGDLAGTATNPTVPGLAQKEVSSNKTVDLTADGASDTKYPSAKAVKIYVDQATLGTALAADLNAKADKNSPVFTGIPQLPSTTIAITQSNGTNSTQVATTAFVQNSISSLSVNDASSSAKGIIQLGGDLGGTASAPLVPGLASKEISSNKSNNIVADALSTTKYPSVKMIKDYVDGQISSGGVSDASTSVKGIVQLAGDLGGTSASPVVIGLAGKEIATNKSIDISADALSTTKYPSVKLIKEYVDTQITNVRVSDASSSAKGIIQLGGDLGGTATAPLVPGLASKEISSNKSNNMGADALSTTKYPSVKMIKDYVDTQITNGSVSDASTTVKGIVQLAGDLSGTSVSPSISTNAVTTIKILNGAVTDEKIDQVSGSKILGNISGDAANVTETVTAAHGGSGTAGTLTGFLYGNGTSAYTATTSIPVAQIKGAELIANKSVATDLGNSTPSDTYYASQKAVKTYVDLAVSGSVGGATLTALDLKENTANKSDAALGTSTTLFPTQNAVKTYVDDKFGVANYITLSNLPLMANGTVLGNFSGATASPSALNTTGSGNLVRASNATITSPVLNGTISGSTVFAVANGGLGTNSMSSGYVKAGNPFFSISAIPVNDVTGAVQKVNGITPDGSGNVAILYGRTYTGTYNGGAFTAVGSPTNSDIYIVSADPTSSNNGRTFIFDGAIWNEISTDQAALDARYLRLSGGNMGGNLSFGIGKKVILQDAPSADTDAVNKAYVDNTVSTGGTPDASSTTSGKIRLAGDITGTATSPSIAANAISTLKIADGAVTDAKISGILSAAKGGTGVDNTGKTITMGGNLVWNGAYATNLTVTAATSLNLPTAGTLSTLAGAEDLTNKSVNGVRPSSLGTGFNLVGGTISKTLTVGNDASIIGSNTGDQTITLSGDMTGSGTGAISATLANSGVVAGDFGSASAIPIITVDTKGRITSITTQTVSSTSPAGTALTDGKIWIGNGSNAASAQSITGDISLSNTGVAAVGTGKITNGMLAGAIDLGSKVTNILPVANGGTGQNTLTSQGILIGNGTSSINSLSGTTAGDIITYSGSAWVANQPTAADATNPGIMTTGTQTLAGAKTFASLTSSGNLSVGGNLELTGSQTNNALTASKAIFTDASKVLTSTGTVGVAQGGTGATTLTSAALLVGAGTSAVTAISPGTDGQVLISRSGVWAAENASPAVTLGTVNASATAKGLTITAGGEISLSPADGTNPGILTTGTQTIAGTKTFSSVNTTGNVEVGGNLLLTGSQTNSALIASKAIFTDASKVLTSTGTVGVAQGGTGASTLTSAALLVGAGTSAVTAISPGTDGQVLISRSGVWAAENASPAVTLGTVNASATAKGLTITGGGEISLSPADGTNPGILTTGIQTIAGAKTFSSVNTTGNVEVGGNLLLTGSQTNSALTASKVIFTDASKVLTSTGTVGVAQGGTGASTLTSAALLVGAGTSAVTAISPGTDGQVLISRSGVWAAENASPAVTLGTVNASATAKGLTITAGGEISLSPADGTNPGILTTGTQTIAGTKTFSSVNTTGNVEVGGNLLLTGSQTNSTLTASKAIFTDASKVLTSTGTVGVAQGGTGTATLTAGSLLVGNGTGAVTSLAPSTAGYVLKVVGSSWIVSAPDTDVNDQFTATVGKLTFTLTQTPAANSKVQMFINGIRIDKTAYSLSTNIITYIPANNSSFTLVAGDRIQFDYAY
jgi:hypothetical protein